MVMGEREEMDQLVAESSEDQDEEEDDQKQEQQEVFMVPTTNAGIEELAVVVQFFNAQVARVAMV